MWLRLLGEDLRAYTILAWMLALVGHAAAWLIHQDGLRPVDDAGRKFQRLACVTNALAGFAFFTASVAGLLSVGVPEGSTVVCVLTGHGLKDPDTALGKAPAVTGCKADLGAVEKAVFD